MPLYYFESRDGESFIEDEDGLDLETAGNQATAALADLVKHVLSGSMPVDDRSRAHWQ